MEIVQRTESVSSHRCALLNAYRTSSYSSCVKLDGSMFISDLQLLTFPEDKDKKKLTYVLEVLGGHFKPTQSVLQRWYQLGSVYSSQGKDQMEFLNKLKGLAADCSFSNKDKVIKFLFLIHNTNEPVKAHLIKHMKPPKNTLADVLQSAKNCRVYCLNGNSFKATSAECWKK